MAPAAFTSCCLRPSLLLVIIATALHCLPPCAAEIFSLSVSNDSRSLIDIAHFGFTQRGRLDLAVSHASWAYAADSDLSLMGFFFAGSGDEFGRSSRLNESAPCVLQTQNNLVVFTFSDLNGSLQLNRSFSAPDAGRFTLMFANCHHDTPISMNLIASLYNLEGLDGTKNFLSEESTRLPSTYAAFSLAFMGLLFIWIFVCVWRRSSVRRVHKLMGLLVYFKALHSLSLAETQDYIRRTGNPNGWDDSYVPIMLKGWMLVTVFMLLDAGWSILKPHLRGNEKRAILIIISFQIFANFADFLITEKSSLYRYWLPWHQNMAIIDDICLGAVQVPLFYKYLRHANSKSPGDNLVIINLFGQYYMVVFCYLYFSRQLILILSIFTSYQFMRVCGVMVSEIATLAFFLFTGYRFRPPLSPYFTLENEEGPSVFDFKL